MTFQGAFFEQLRDVQMSTTPRGMHTALLLQPKSNHRSASDKVKNFLRPFFKRYDLDNDGGACGGVAHSG
jgi:hypothetical protein|eukprot:SAG25_NODE_3383_length_1103_cov_0.869522_2_plen_70_part_00